ncbi:MAG: hypothetical protein R2849_16510 [Thermomicrobiales bacterium]
MSSPFARFFATSARRREHGRGSVSGRCERFHPHARWFHHRAKGPEVKNMNSFRAVERALEYEVIRQRQAIEDGETLVQETRGWVDDRQVTVSQRTKEFAEDYRYFPEPDLPPLVVQPGLGRLRFVTAWRNFRRTVTSGSCPTTCSRAAMPLF